MILPVRANRRSEQRRIVTELDALQAEVDALKRLQAETAAELDALLPAQAVTASMETVRAVKPLPQFGREN